MNKKEESIINLLIEKDKYKKLSEDYQDILQWILTKCYSIGAPLNDNILKFNDRQLKWLLDIVKTIKYGIDNE
jgi:hypothetical protein